MRTHLAPAPYTFRRPLRAPPSGIKSKVGFILAKAAAQHVEMDTYGVPGMSGST